jgi:hypothetical protein
MQVSRQLLLKSFRRLVNCENFLTRLKIDISVRTRASDENHMILAMWREEKHVRKSSEKCLQTFSFILERERKCGKFSRENFLSHFIFPPFSSKSEKLIIDTLTDGCLKSFHTLFVSIAAGEIKSC